MENSYLLEKLIEKIESLEKEVKFLREEVKKEQTPETLNFPTPIQTPPFNPNQDLVLGGPGSRPTWVVDNTNFLYTTSNDGDITSPVTIDNISENDYNNHITDGENILA